MKHLFVCVAITGICSLVVSTTAFAGKKHLFQQPAKDSLPVKMIDRLTVTVKDLSDGEPLDSVYVLIRNKKGFTNSNGSVTFDSIPSGSMIYASKNGYLAQSKKAKRSLVLHLAKRESASSSKDYNNGLFQRPFEHFSGTATVVSGAELRKINPLNFVDALKYYAPSFIATKDNRYGDDPNVPASVKVRGAYNFPASATISSYSGVQANGRQLDPSEGDFVAEGVSNPNQPVILLNGIQVSLQTALDMDIQHIERITILKDAAAASQYGVRGGNGVLLIQTNQPQKGALNVTYSGQVQASVADLSSFQVLNASEKLQLEQAAGLFAGNSALYESRLYQVNKGLNTDWLKIPTRTGVSNKHYLSLDGGDDDINYGLNFSFNDVKGVMKGSKRQVANFGGFLSTRLRNIVISNYLAYTKTNSANSPYGSFSDYALQNPYWNPIDSITGKMTKRLEEFTSMGNIFSFYNPAYNATLTTTDEKVYSRLNNLTSINWNLGYGLRLTGRFSFIKQADEENFFLPPGHTAFSNLSPANFATRGSYNKTMSDFMSWESAVNLHYTKKKGLHLLYASAGVSAQETKSESAGLQVAGFVSDKMSDLSFGNAYSTSQPITGIIKTRLASAYGNVTYSFDNRYQLEVTGNADESSQFGKNNLIAPHWAVGGSWNVHQERFFQANKIVNQLRVRGSVGTAGNQFYQSYLGHSYYNYFTDRQYIRGSSTLGEIGVGLGAFLTGFANHDLKAPETQKQNIGLDAVLLQNRLFIKADFYRNKTTNIVLPVNSPVASTGFMNFNYYDNVGAIENKGIEFDINYAIIQNSAKGIQWSVRLNGIHNQDRVLSTSAYIDTLNDRNNSIADQTRPHSRFIVGQSLTGIWAVRSLGIDPATGQEKFLKTDGTETFVWDAADKVLAGDLIPTLQGSFGTSLTIKNITGGIYFNYQLGASYYNQNLADRIENADINYNVDRRAAGNRWKNPGDIALYKPLSVNGMLSSPTYATTRFVEKANLLNCSAISLDYNLPQNIASKIKAKNAKVGFIANNAFQSGEINAEQGIYYPVQRTYTFSLTTSF